MAVDPRWASHAPLFDSHCHINSREFDGDRCETVARMRSAGLVGAVVVGCDRGEEKDVAELVHRYPGFLTGAWALHPEYEDRPETSVDEILSICAGDEFSAVGETGLDYHWCSGNLNWQRDRFRMHIRAAKILGKPLIVHAREAEADAVEILAAEKAGETGFVLHCYGGDLETAKKALDAGGLVSFTGVVTFKNARRLQEVARNLPLESIMIETDCPYMAPVPLHGHRNEPAYVEYVARKIASLKEVEYETVAQVTAATARRFFHLLSPSGQ